MAKARAIPGLAEAKSFREGATRAVETRAEEVFEHREGVLDLSDVERVHDMRVATRRLRAAAGRRAERRLTHLEHVPEPLGGDAHVVEGLDRGRIPHGRGERPELLQTHAHDPPQVLLERPVGVEPRDLARLHSERPCTASARSRSRSPP